MRLQHSISKKVFLAHSNDQMQVGAWCNTKLLTIENFLAALLLFCSKLNFFSLFGRKILVT